MPTNLSNKPLQDALSSIAEFQRLTTDIPYERKGILFSEMFFFWLCARTVKPQRILESGRARGQSTLILSHCFPDAEIISVEYDSNSPDVLVASERLKGRDNVQQLFGDATRLLPKIAQTGDIAIIDGPKGYRGLRLALHLLSQGKMPFVFMHDTAIDSPERRYLSQRMPETSYSDLPAFSEIAHSLDQGVWDELPNDHRWTPTGAPAAGYGFSLACLPYAHNRNYQWLRLLAILDGLNHRLLRR